MLYLTVSGHLNIVRMDWDINIKPPQKLLKYFMVFMRDENVSYLFKGVRYSTFIRLVATSRAKFARQIIDFDWSPF